jgi:hypothetical protein
LTNTAKWAIGEHGPPFRLPPKGPTAPMNVPTLLLVTQAHHLHAWLLPPYISTVPVRIVKAPLQEASTYSMALYQASSDFPDISADSRGGRRICTHATIGLSYNGTPHMHGESFAPHIKGATEPSLMVATRSKLLPPVDPNQLTFGANIDLGIPLEIPTESTGASQWDQWEEESIICMCAVGIIYRGMTAGREIKVDSTS